MFDDKSRYASLPTRELVLPDGRRVAYVTRRFVPPAEAYTVAGGVTVTDSERLDLLAHRGLGTPLGFWMLADANGALHPAELTAEPGRSLAVPLPVASLPGGPGVNR